MSNPSNWRVARLLGFAMLVVGLAAGAFAQALSGNIFGTVVDADGAALPGVTVTLSGVGATQVFVTDAEGNFRFLGLSPGSYTVAAELAGFGSVVRTGVQANIGRNTNITMELTPALEQTITVTAETPLLDVRKTGSGATVTELELEEVPTARDPWVILQQAPGVLMDRINVGGNQSGQQSGFVSKGVGSDDAAYNIDGVNTTDMIATGAASSYYDFGAFEEIQITTSGTDPRIKTPGAQINMVTKRGTNELEGSARYYTADGDWQADPDIPTEALDYISSVPRIKENTEWGVEIGGPIIRDRLWAWGAYADQQVDIIPVQRVGDFIDATTLKTKNFKLNAQITASNSATGFAYSNDKVKLGRNLSTSRPVDAAWNQSGFGDEWTYKIEDTHIFSPNFYLTGLYSSVAGGFQLIATGDQNCADPTCAQSAATAPWFDYLNGHWNDGYISVTIERPQEELRADASSFFDTGALSHELKFGYGHRTASVDSRVFWNGPGAAEYGGQYETNLGAFYVALGYDEEFLGYDVSDIRGVNFASYAPYMYEYEYDDFYVGDTILWGDLTFQVGLRFDSQTGTLDPVQAPAVAGYEDILPALTISSLPEMPDWDTMSPRIGVTYALGEENRTLLRGAYNRYVTQMGSNSTSADSLLPFVYRWVYAYGIDSNGDGVVSASEILNEDSDHPACADGLFVCEKAPYWGGFDITDPTNTGTPEVRLGDVDAPYTDEFMVGIDHELMPEFVVGVNYTHREMKDFIYFPFEKTPGSGDFYTSADYVQVDTLTPDSIICPEGNPGCSQQVTGLVGSYSIPVYGLREEVVEQFGQPTYQVMMNRPDYSQSYDGLELSAVKRMSNRWMLRGNFTWMDWKQDVGPNAFTDPTPTRAGFGCAGAPEFCDGEDVVAGSGTISGAFGGVWVNSEWSYNLTGVYQIPVVEANIGFNLTGRQGYPILYIHEYNPPANRVEGTKNVLVSGVTGQRHDDLHQLDLRLSKDFRFQGVGLQFSVDAFNVLDEQAVLQRDADLVDYITANDSQVIRAGANNILELQSAQIFRVGARLTF